MTDDPAKPKPTKASKVADLKGQILAAAKRRKERRTKRKTTTDKGETSQDFHDRILRTQSAWDRIV